MWGSGKRWERSGTRVQGQAVPRREAWQGPGVTYPSGGQRGGYAPANPTSGDETRITYTASSRTAQTPVRPRATRVAVNPAARWVPEEPAYPSYSPASSWPHSGTDDPYGASHSASAAGMRETTTARPITREQQLAVIEMEERSLAASGVHDFSPQLDLLIAASTAQHQVVLPRAKPPKAQRAARGLTAVAALTTRAALGFLILVALMSAITALTGHPPIPVQALSLAGISPIDDGANQHVTVDGKVVTRVQAFTQMRRADLYDNKDQFNAWGGSACSAAVLAEILTAYGVQHATIGSMIDELGSSISQQWGLVSYDGFGKVAAKHGLRADTYVDHPLTYKQMQYITNTLGIPLIVNVRATTGYYHYLSGGHFLVMTGGDDQTIRLVDSSLYYIKSLPLSTFMGMYRNRSVAIVPTGYTYTLPS